MLVAFVVFGKDLKTITIFKIKSPKANIFVQKRKLHLILIKINKYIKLACFHSKPGNSFKFCFHALQTHEACYRIAFSEFHYSHSLG